MARRSPGHSRIGSDRVFDLLEGAAQRLTQMLLLAIVCIVTTQVFCRFALNASLVWSEEVSGWCMVWVVFIGAILLMRRDGLVSIPIFVLLLPPAARAPAVLASRAAAVAASLFLAWYGFWVVAGTFNIVSEATGVSTRYIKLCVPISGALMALYAIANLAADVARLYRSGGNAVVVPGSRRAEQPLRGASAEL